MHTSYPSPVNWRPSNQEFLGSLGTTWDEVQNVTCFMNMFFCKILAGVWQPLSKAWPPICLSHLPLALPVVSLMFLSPLISGRVKGEEACTTREALASPYYNIVVLPCPAPLTLSLDDFISPGLTVRPWTTCCVHLPSFNLKILLWRIWETFNTTFKPLSRGTGTISHIWQF